MLFFKPKKYLGIDIGTSSIKLVELKKEGDKIALNTYGQLKIINAKEDAGKIDIMHIPEKQFSDMLSRLMIASKTTAKDAVFSIPVFSSFVTLIDLPLMSAKELAEAIPFEARKYIPVPIEEVEFSYSVVEKMSGAATPAAPLVTGVAVEGIAVEVSLPGQGLPDKMQVLLIAVPNEIISRYKNIAKNAGLSANLEIETFSVVRSLIKKGIDDKGVVVIVDIGAKSTEICVVDNGLLRLSHNFEASGMNITKMIVQNLNISPEEAEELKIKQGLTIANKAALDGILPLIDMIIFEIERTVANYQQRTGRRAQKVILSGGSATLPGIVDYITNHTGLIVTVADPFAKISASPVLSPILRDIGPTFSVAVGLAERNLL